MLQVYFIYLVMCLSLLSACCVICHSNAVYSVFFLCLCFVSTAILWLYLLAEFFAIILVLVYIGALLVLFLFTIMLIDLKIEYQKNNKFFFFFIFSFFFLVVFFILNYYFGINYLDFLKTDPYMHKNMNLKVPYCLPLEILAICLSVQYLLEFALIGILLLVGIIAAISLTFRGSQNRKVQNIYQQVKQSSNISLFK